MKAGSVLMLFAVSLRHFPLRYVRAFAAPPLLSTTTTTRQTTSRLFTSTNNKPEEETLNKSEQLLTSFENQNNLRDQVVSVISQDGGIKVTVVTLRNLVNDVMMQHVLTPTPADALGRTLACAVLMSNGMQDEQTLQITLNSNGPLRGVVAICDGTAAVKGYVGSPQVGDMHLPEAIGKGFVQIVKNHPDWPNPYNGITAIRHGDVDRDIGLYLAESEQKSCALAAATTMNGILCTSAGGYLIEQLPGVSEEEMAQVEHNLAALVELDGGDKLPTNLLLKGKSPLDICELILKDLDLKPLQQLTPTLTCDCTDERLVRALRLLPKEDVEEILQTQEVLEARCEFCAKVYRMGPEDVRHRLETAKGDPARDDEQQK